MTLQIPLVIQGSHSWLISVEKKQNANKCVFQGGKPNLLLFCFHASSGPRLVSVSRYLTNTVMKICKVFNTVTNSVTATTTKFM